MKATIAFFLVTIAQARFGQENVPIAAISVVKGGAPGVAPTIAGAAISDLLGGANACDKLRRGDQILAELGEGADALAAAIGMVAAEKNFNPSAQDKPTVCGDPALPQNPLLRGVTPKVDPAVTNADVANSLSAQSVKTPLTSNDKSIADLLTENGFTNFIVQGGAVGANQANQVSNGAVVGSVGDKKVANGTSPIAAASNSTGQALPVTNTSNGECNCVCPAAAVTEKANKGKKSKQAAVAVVTTSKKMAHKSKTAGVTATAVTKDAVKMETAAIAGMHTVTKAGIDASPTKAQSTSENGNASAVNANNNKGGNDGNGSQDQAADQSSGADANTGAANPDFGSCDPTMSFEGGRANRAATEFTFQSNDAVIAANQQEALNPNIITNRICDELINICKANAAAISICDDAQAQILALGTRDQSTADAWNSLVAGSGARKVGRRWQ